MVEVACQSRSAEKYTGSTESQNRSRRLLLLREQLRRENRRSAAPFSHPLASQEPLCRLREQIRDVSRIADAVATSADSATDSRLNELCSDLRRLMQTQQRWTERLENQIWRLESQQKLMRRLQLVLLQGSPGTDQLWELCELIARETQSIPDGILLLPEPGHRIVLTSTGINGLAASTIEQARFNVFAGMSILPDVRGADLVAGTFHSSAKRVIHAIRNGEADESVSQMLTFAEQLTSLTPTRGLNPESERLIELTHGFTAIAEQRSLEAVDNLVPPAIREFYSELVERWPKEGKLDESTQEMALAFCRSLSLADSPTTTDSTTAHSIVTDDDDAAIVLAHKLRWHDGNNANEESFAAGLQTSRERQAVKKQIRRPNFLKPSSEGSRLSVFCE